MGTTKVLLVGVCEYLTFKCPSLPMCRNDLFAMRKALVKGLNINPSNIHLSGETGIVTKNDFITSIYTVLKDISENDTFIFYFSGHGGKNCLVLSDGLIELQDLLNTIELIQTKNKIAIIDSCHSGDFSLENIPTIDIDETVEHFAGRGFAVLASCGADQYSDFKKHKKLSNNSIIEIDNGSPLVLLNFQKNLSAIADREGIGFVYGKGRKNRKSNSCMKN